MTPLTQTKVLRVLQDQQFERVGGSETVRTDVRLIAATNRNLTDMMNEGTFRSDLFYRLNVFTIYLPPLRARNGDLPLLVEHFLKRFSKELEKDVREVSSEAMDRLTTYQWPGNLRELQSVIKHAVVESTGPVILAEHLPESVRVRLRDNHSSGCAAAKVGGLDEELIEFIRNRVEAGTESLYDDVVQRVERTLFTELLHRMEGNISRVSSILGISRSTLRSKLATLGINLDRSVRLSE